MLSSADHPRLAPPQPGRWLGPLGMALVIHGLLVAALTWGVGWQREAPPVVFEAEIWSRQPQAAVPRTVEAPTPVAPQTKAPTPVPRPAPAPPPPGQADITTAQAKKQAAEAAAKRSQAEAEKKAAEEKTAAANKAATEQARQQQREQERRAEKELQQAEQERNARIREIVNKAGPSDGQTSTAQRASGPSASYGGRVAARIKPNVVFTEAIAGNPRAEVEVRTLPDGTITARRIVTPSGNPAWDEAVLRAIDRTATLPRDTDGRVPPSLIIGLRPLD